MSRELPSYYDKKWSVLNVAALSEWEWCLFRHMIAERNGVFCSDDVYVIENSSWIPPKRRKIAKYRNGVLLEICSLGDLYLYRQYLEFKFFLSFFEDSMEVEKEDNTS